MIDRTCTVDGCEKPQDNTGMCWMHYSRLRRHGDLNHGRPPLVPAVERIMSNVVVTRGPLPTDCWVCSLGVKPTGYTTVTLARQARRSVACHRFLYELRHGPIPADHELDHLCRVRNCVNPDHLEPVTHLVNVLRSYEARRTAALEY